MAMPSFTFPRSASCTRATSWPAPGPLIDYPGGGSLADWGKTLDGALTLDFDTVIPGTRQSHGQSRAHDISPRMSQKLKTRVSGLIREGKTQNEIAMVMTTEYNWAPNSLNMQWSLPGMMTELK